MSHDATSWYKEMGIDEVITDAPIDRTEQQETIVPKVKQVANTASKQASDTRVFADKVDTLNALKDYVKQYKGLDLVKTATQAVFCDGNPDSEIMFIGEAPGADEDAKGIPFCGASGQLLDQMLAYIGLERPKNFYISNTVFWRPPGNRKPLPEELSVCEPLVQKHIALIRPKLLILVGGTAVGSLLDSKLGITKIRGSFLEYSNPYLETPIPTTAIFHPSYLLRSPGQKHWAWQDLLKIRAYIKEQGIML